MVGNHDPLSKASLNQINHPACNRRRGLEYRGRSEDRVEAKVEEVVGGERGWVAKKRGKKGGKEAGLVRRARSWDRRQCMLPA